MTIDIYRTVLIVNRPTRSHQTVDNDVHCRDGERSHAALEGIKDRIDHFEQTKLSSRAGQLLCEDFWVRFTVLDNGHFRKWTKCEMHKESEVVL